MTEDTIDALNQRQHPMGLAAEPKPAGIDLFDACLDMMNAMQAMMFAGFAVQTEAVDTACAAPSPACDGVSPQPIMLVEPSRGASPPQPVTSRPEAAPRSWYRRPVETPFGSYMHGSGMFVPGGMLTGLVEACWQPQAEMALRMAGQVPGMNPINAGQFGFGAMNFSAMNFNAMNSMAPMASMQAQPWMAPWATAAMLPGWNPSCAAMSPFAAPYGTSSAGDTSRNFEMPAQAMLAMWSEAAGSMVAALSAMLSPMAGEQPAPAPDPVTEPVMARPRVTEASYRTSGGHAAATVVAPKHAPLMPATLPMALGLSGLLVLAHMASSVGAGLA